jgi:RNA polymerase-binding transcription factor DksA
MDHNHNHIQTKLLTERQLILVRLDQPQDLSLGQCQVEQCDLLQMRDKLARILRALERLEKGMYGWCLSCHQPIDPDRLGALPEAEFCHSCRPRLGYRLLKPVSSPHLYIV